VQLHGQDKILVYKVSSVNTSGRYSEEHLSLLEVQRRMAVPQLRQLVAGFSKWKPRFLLGKSIWGFVVVKVALEQVFFRVLLLSR
jgi:hypothetical protein